MPKHPSKKVSKGTRTRKRIVRRVKQAVANERLRSRVEIARDKKVRAERGQKRDTKTSPGIRAQVRNLDVHGERIPVRTEGKIDKGGPIKRTAVAFKKFQAKQTKRVTDKKVAANKRRRDRKQEKVVMGKIRKLRNDRFRREQEKKALNKRADEMSGRKKKP